MDKNRIFSSGLNALRTVVGAALLVAAVGVYSGDGSIVNLGANNISVTANISGATAIELRVAGPGSYYTSKRSESGSANWYAPSGLPDGEYRFEVFVTVGSEAEDGDNTQLYRKNGRFSMKGGILSPVKDVVPTALPDEASVEPKRSGTASIFARIGRQVLEFLIPSAHALDLTISDPTPQLFFDDTDDGVNNEWDLRGDSANFYLLDVDTSRFAYKYDKNSVQYWDFNTTHAQLWSYNALGASLYIDAAAGLDVLRADSAGDIELADGSVFIDKSANRMGVGTITPQRDLHVLSANPALALEDTGGYTWTLNNSMTATVFDINWNDGVTSTSPVNILAGAPGNSFYISNTGLIGMGTNFPSSALHVSRNNGTAQLLVEETGGFASRIMQRLKNNGPTALYLEDSSVTGGTWSFTMNFNNFVINNVASTGLKIVAGADNTYRVQNKGTGVETMKVQANGNMVIAGLLTTGSSRTIKDNINTVEHSNILSKLDELPVSYWNYKTTNADDRHVGPMAEDFYDVFNLGNSNKHIAPSDLAGIALAAAKALNKKSTKLSRENAQQKKVNNELKQRIQVLEGKMADLVQVITMKEASLKTLASVQ